MALEVPGLSESGTFQVTSPVVPGYIKNDLSGNFLFGQAAPGGGGPAWDLIEHKVLIAGEQTFDFASCGTLNGDVDEIYQIFFSSLGPVEGIENSGAAVAANLAGTTVTLAASASAVTGAYVGYTLRMTSGPAAGLMRNITIYSGVTKLATVAPAFSPAPVAGNTYEVLNRSFFLDVRINAGAVPSATFGTILSQMISYTPPIATAATNLGFSSWRVGFTNPLSLLTPDVAVSKSIWGKVILYIKRGTGGSDWNRTGMSFTRVGTPDTGLPGVQQTVVRWRQGSSPPNVTCVGFTSNHGNLPGSEFWFFKKA